MAKEQAVKEYIPYGRHYVDDDDIAEVVKVLKSDWLTTGPVVYRFEKAFASYVGSKYAVAVANGTAALHLACLAAGLCKDDELITSPITFVASANCALYCGAKPVFADIKADGSGLIDPGEIEKTVTDKTKIIIPVHYGGLPCDMEEIQKIALDNDLIVIEDACHALGATYKDSKIGDCKYSDMAVFSFHPVKHITTGEGGMITTNNKEFYDKLVMLRSHGITRDPDKLQKKDEGPWYYEMQMLGFNYRLTDIQCALGLSQLKKIDRFVARRREIAKMYDDAFAGSDCISGPVKYDDRESAYHLYTIRLNGKLADKRKEVFENLRANGIGVQVHYIPVNQQPYYQRMFDLGESQNAENYYNTIMSLPIYCGLDFNNSLEKIKKIVEIDK